MNKIKNYQLIATILTFGLIIFSIYLVYDASSVWAKYKYNDEFFYLKRQTIYAIIAIIFFVIGTRINLLKYKRFFLPALVFCNLLLVLVLIPGIGINKGGSSSWLGFSFFSFQPSELYKICLIIYISHYLSENFYHTKSIKIFLPLILIMVIGAVMIMLQPDFGTLVVTFSAVIIIFFISKLPLRYFIGGGGIIVALAVIMIISEPYRMQRIVSFVDPFQDPLGSGFQIIQSMFALGPGGLMGEGINASIQKYYYLPEPQTDFIFCIAVEELGFIGGLIIIIVYFALFYYLYKISKFKNQQFNYLLSIGLISLIAVQVIINLGVVTALFPVTGITLPFLSYGGSSLISLSFAVGLIIGGKNT